MQSAQGNDSSHGEHAIHPLKHPEPEFQGPFLDAEASNDSASLIQSNYPSESNETSPTQVVYSDLSPEQVQAVNWALWISQNNHAAKQLAAVDRAAEALPRNTIVDETVYAKVCALAARAYMNSHPEGFQALFRDAFDDEESAASHRPAL
jgi:hypothetical protein